MRIMRLIDFCMKIGIPSEMMPDGARVLTLSEWGKMCVNTKLSSLEQNHTHHGRIQLS